jgi:hypothetical protein
MLHEKVIAPDGVAFIEPAIPSAEPAASPLDPVA